jgi:hypothetical protein
MVSVGERKGKIRMKQTFCRQRIRELANHQSNFLRPRRSIPENDRLDHQDIPVGNEAARIRSVAQDHVCCRALVIAILNLHILLLLFPISN